MEAVSKSTSLSSVARSAGELERICCAQTDFQQSDSRKGPGLAQGSSRKTLPNYPGLRKTHVGVGVRGARVLMGSVYLRSEAQLAQRSSL